MTTLEANELDGRGVSDLKTINDAIRAHQAQTTDLLKRRKDLILRLRKQRITYKEMAKIMDVSEQLIYKIIKNDIDRTPQYDAEGKVIRFRGRPPKPKSETSASSAE